MSQPLLPKPKATKLNRTASKWWALCVNRALAFATGRGLEQFASTNTPVVERPGKPDVTEIAAERRSMSISMDQHSVGISATQFFAGYLKLNVQACYDPSHRVANDLNKSLGGAGFMDMVHLSSIVFNLHAGPYEAPRMYYNRHYLVVRR